MKIVGIREAKTHLSRLVERAQAGEESSSRRQAARLHD
jgi:antitoxin (DNA-binding transcriptional repressor) of toxin-antitoxin stability system